jgi:mono/diheme cytochrome c family protein
MKSRITKILEEKHKGVEVDPESRRRIYAWIDSNVIYYPSFDMTRPHTMGGRDTFYDVDPNTRGPLKPHPWFAQVEKIYDHQCAQCHGELSASVLSNKQQWINLSRPQNSRLLNAHLAKEAGGYGLVGRSNGKPDFLVWESRKNPLYMELFSAIMEGKQALERKPRLDMPGAVIIHQPTDFGRTF